MVNIIINKKIYSVPSNWTVYKACFFYGFIIPRFCFHERIIVAGNCRMCLVEVKGSPKLEVSCTKQVIISISIITDSPSILKAQEIVLEFLLKSHPLDCPVCDQGGACDLQNYSSQFGSNISRFFEEKPTVKIKSWGVLINTIMTRCISCTRCTRFSLEYIENKFLGIVGRGNSSEISIFQQQLLKSIFSGNLVDLCPVGALSSKFFKQKCFLVLLK